SESVRLGEATFEEFCSRCHGDQAQGGTVKRYVTPGVKGAKPTAFPAPNLREMHPRPPDEDVATVAWTTIQKGRPPTPMPTWGVRYGGPMNDQQITDLVNYILSIQSDNKKRPLLQFEAAGGRRAEEAGKEASAPVKGLLVVLTGFVLLPGSVWMLLASNFGALKGYLIAGTAFFGFLMMLSAVGLVGIPGTTPLTGPKGPQPTFVPFTINDPAASTYDSVRDFQGGAGNGWQGGAEGGGGEGS